MIFTSLYEAKAILLRTEEELVRYERGTGRLDRCPSFIEERERLAKEVEGLFFDTRPVSDSGDHRDAAGKDVSDEGLIELSDDARRDVPGSSREREAQFTEELAGLECKSGRRWKTALKRTYVSVVSDP
jgi:hypothetical protein